MAGTTEVGSRELRARLGRYLRQVRRGRTLIVTDRGKPVAELRPLPAKPREQAAESDAWERLYADGTVTRPTRRRLTPFEPVRSPPGHSLSDAIRQERDEGY